jgi:23S rRNA maturation mini-RNase III
MSEHKFNLLLGAVTEYIDDGEVSEFLTDLKRVLDEEEDSFIKKALNYKDLRKKLFSK